MKKIIAFLYHEKPFLFLFGKAGSGKTLSGKQISRLSDVHFEDLEEAWDEFERRRRSP